MCVLPVSSRGGSAQFCPGRGHHRRETHWPGVFGTEDRPVAVEADEPSLGRFVQEVLLTCTVLALRGSWGYCSQTRDTVLENPVDQVHITVDFQPTSLLLGKKILARGQALQAGILLGILAWKGCVDSQPQTAGGCWQIGDLGTSRWAAPAETFNFVEVQFAFAFCACFSHPRVSKIII